MRATEGRQLTGGGPQCASLDVKTRLGGAVASATPVDWSQEVVLRVRAAMRIRGRVIGDAGTSAQINLISKEEL